MEFDAYNSYMEVDLGILAKNYDTVKDFIGPEHGLIPVLKSNAYGLGTQAMAGFYLNECKTRIVACAQVLEGLEMREAGYSDCDILVMGGVPDHLLRYVVEYDLQIPIFTAEGVRKLSAAARLAGKRANTQLKIETGLGRIGVKPGAGLDNLLAEVRSAGNINVCGLFTHFSSATAQDDPFTYEQYGIFRQALDQIAPACLDLIYIHCCNTAASSWFKEGYHTHIRVGCIIMGYDYGTPAKPPYVEEPVSWRSFITHIHEIRAGESCGYYRFYKAEKDTRVAIVGVGYGDGLSMPLATGGGPVLVNDTRTRYLAACMDQCFIDVTCVDCKTGDEVTLYGRSRGGAALPMQELKQISGQGFLSMLVSLNHRVKRIYVNQ